MYETVKIVKGYSIQRMKGCHGQYHVTLSRNGSAAKMVYFRTIKAAAQYIIENL